MSNNKIKLYIHNPLRSVIQDKFDKLQTGDILLCHGYNPDGPDPGIDGLIEIFTDSPWEHAAIIIRDPWWTDAKKKNLKGLYVLQSGWGPNGYPDVLNGKVKGVTLNKLDDFLCNRKYIFIRTLQNYKFDNNAKMLFFNLFEITHGKPYDANVCSWIGTGIGSCCKCPCFSILTTPKEDKTFWCSALVSYFYTKMELCDKNTDWSCQTPVNLAKLELNYPYKLSELWQLK